MKLRCNLCGAEHATSLSDEDNPTVDWTGGDGWCGHEDVEITEDIGNAPAPARSNIPNNGDVPP